MHGSTGVPLSHNVSHNDPLAPITRHVLHRFGMRTTREQHLQLKLYRLGHADSNTHTQHSHYHELLHSLELLLSVYIVVNCVWGHVAALFHCIASLPLSVLPS